MSEAKHTPGPWEWRQPYEGAEYSADREQFCREQEADRQRDMKLERD